MYVRVEYPKLQAFTDDGLFAVGYEIHTRKAGLSANLTTYSERTLTATNENPVVLNARGEADIYVGEAAKLIFTESISAVITDPAVVPTYGPEAVRSSMPEPV